MLMRKINSYSEQRPSTVHFIAGVCLLDCGLVFIIYLYQAMDGSVCLPVMRADIFCLDGRRSVAWRWYNGSFHGCER